MHERAKPEQISVQNTFGTGHVLGKHMTCYWKSFNDKLELEMQNKYKPSCNKLKKPLEKQVITNASKENIQQDAVTQDASFGFRFSTSYANLRQSHIFKHQI